MTRRLAQLHPLLQGLLVWVSVYLLAAWLGPSLGWLGVWVGYFASFLLCVGLASLVCVRGLERPLSRPSAQLLGGGALLVMGALGVLRGVTLAHLLLSSIALIVLAFLIGRAIAERVERAAHLLPVALVVATADTWSVLAPEGLTQQLIAKPEFVPLLVITYPYLGTPDIPAFIGAADLCVATLFVHAADRFELSRRRSRLALVLGFSMTLVAVTATGLPIPALPFLSLAFISLNPATLRLEPKEWLQLAAFVAVFGGLGLALRFL